MALKVKSQDTQRGDLYAVIARGKNKGIKLYPHRHEDGMYVVSPTRFERDYIRIPSKEGLVEWLSKGYRLRMSNSVAGVSAPSLIRPTSISRETRE
ncbi:hypothetical protein ACVWXM_006218 [Bradyrhizobium sp. GM7.3]